MNLYLGIDIGTSGCKLALHDESGNVKFSSGAEYPSHYPFPGAVEQNPDDWWQGVCRTLSDIWNQGARPEDVVAVSIDGQSWSAIALDGDGETIAPTPIWMDTRAAGICRDWEKRLGAENIFKVSGNPFSPTYTLPKVLYWMEREPEIIEKAQHILQSNSFIAYRLTSEVSMDLSMSYGWHNFSQSEQRFDEALTREMGIPSRFLEEPVPSHSIVGRVTDSASRLTGLLAGTPVAAGGLDAACAALGAGVISMGQTQEQGGQAGGMSICLDKPIAHPELIWGAHVIPGKWLLQGGTVGGGALIKWFSNTLGALSEDGSSLELMGSGLFKRLDAEAEGSRPGSNGLICLPYFAGERSPIWDEKAKGVYFGLKFSTTHGDMARAAMEGSAFALRHNIDIAKSAGAEIAELRGVGGGANSRLWTQIKADITKIPMVIPDSDGATTRGAAMLAMVGVGAYEDFARAAEAQVKIKRRQEPNPENGEIYDKYYEIYKSIYPCTSDLMGRLDELEAKE